MIRTSEVARAVLTRFAPCLGALFGLGFVGRALTAPHELHWSGIGVATIEAVMMSFGYAITLLTLRRALPPETRLSNWRSVIAAALTLPLLGVVSLFTQGATTATITVLSVAAGCASGLLFWAPRLWRPRPPARTLDELEAEADARLLSLGAADLTQVPSPRRPDDIPLPQRERSRFSWRRRVA